MLFQLYPLRQPLLTRNATEALAALCSSSASHLSPAALAEVLTVSAGAGGWGQWLRGGRQARVLGAVWGGQSQAGLGTHLDATTTHTYARTGGRGG
jgi:hypothetical protein